MLEGQSFVYFGPERWQSMWRNRHHLLSRLAARNTVVYVEPRPYLEQVVAQWRGGAQTLRQMARAPRLSLNQPGLWVYNPPALAPLGGPLPVRAAAHALRRGLLRRDLARIDARQPVVWISSPTQHDARLDLPARLRVYHIVDDYLAYHDLAESHRAGFAQRERELIEWADLVIAVSPELIASKGAGNPKFRLLPNGFDADAYGPDRRVDGPAAFDGLPSPILGYVGLISVRLDLAMLNALMAAHSEWSLVMMGTIYRQGCEADLDALARRPNVRILPPVPGSAVADFVRSFDVGLTPYRVTKETVHASPLKIYEYLAAGLPVVAADVPGARQFAGNADAVRIAGSPVEWGGAIAGAIECDNPAARAARRALVAPHTWESRVETLSSYLLEALA